MSAKEAEDIKQLIEQINKEIPDLKENIMTYAEELMQKGEQRGIQLGEQKGEQKAQIEIAKNLLRSGVSQDIVSAATKLSLEQIKTLN